MTKSHKQWISVQADGRLVAALDREAKARGVSRSGAIREAVEGWILRAMEEDEERIARAQANHRQVMNRLDFLVGMIREQEKRETRQRSQRDGASRSAPDSRRPGRTDEEPEIEPEHKSGALAEARKRARRRFE